MRQRLAAACLALALAAASAASAREHQVAATCAGSHYSLPAAVLRYLTPATDAEAQASGLLTGNWSGVKPDGEGGICRGEVFKVTADGLRLWRVSSVPTLPGALGSWWSFDKADDVFTTRAKWRNANAVCKGWNRTADYILSCPVKQGAFILVGGTQSANCRKAGAGSDELYPRDATTQVDLNARAAIDASLCSKPAKIARWTDAGK